MVLYEVSLQVIPVLMITLFLDTRMAAGATAAPQRWVIIQNQLYIVLSVSAFAVSLAVVADILAHGRFTQALVIGALMGCIALLAVQAWGRAKPGPRPSRPDQ